MPQLSESPASSADPAGRATQQWWRDAVIYQVYPRSFADADGDGVGDLPGVAAKLPYLAALGVDAVWLSPFYVSPQADAGYDVADYRDIDPVFGSMADADALLATAAEHGIRVVVDLVPNHTSDEHAWFVEALAAGPGSPQRELYVFRDGRGAGGDLPPNNWRSVFGGSAWERVTGADGSPGQWYLHIFDVKQPDLNWEHPQVRAEFHDILRFWLDKGVHGFRVDVAHGLIKEAGLPDWDHEQELLHGADGTGARPPMWDQDGVHEVYRGWREVLDSYPGDRMLVAEAWVEPAERLAMYIRPDEMHQAFNFEYLTAHWRAADLREVIDASLTADARVGAPTTWVLSNHDVVRHTSRLGLPVGTPRPRGISADDPQPDAVLGLRRARAATTLMLSLPGSAYLYQGEELGLPEHTALPAAVRQDPAFLRTAGEELGRDGCRIPMPWTAAGPSLGFGPSELTWLPQPQSYAALAADQQVGVQGSTFELYRALLRLRREHGLGRGRLEWSEAGPDALDVGNGPVRVLVNFGTRPLPLPADADVLVASGSLAEGGAALPTDTAVWLLRRG